VPKSCGPDLAALVRSHTALDPDIFASLVTAAEVHGVPLPTWAEFRPDGGGPVTAVVEPVPWGKKSGPLEGLQVPTSGQKLNCDRLASSAS